MFVLGAHIPFIPQQKQTGQEFFTLARCSTFLFIHHSLQRFFYTHKENVIFDLHFFHLFLCFFSDKALICASKDQPTSLAMLGVPVQF